jgi:hypothetical protein
MAIGIALMLPVSSWAASSTKAQEKSAKKACAAGDFRKGVEILAELYVETNDVNHIFNQGRCYEQNHQWESAIDRFREYLRKNKGSATEQAEAERHLADCESFQQKEEAKLAPQAVVVPPPAPVVQVAPAAVPEPAPAPAPVIERTETRSENRGVGLRVTGIVLGSLGIAAAATGVVLNLKANSLGDEYNRTQSESTKSSRNTYKTGALVGYAAGGGLLVTGIILYLVGHSAGADEPASTTAILPVVSPSQFSLAFRSQF